MATNASEIQSRLSTAVQRIRSNSNLSTEGKQRLMAREYVAARRDLASLKEAATAATAAQRGQLERRLFGVPRGADPSAIISYRDAIDRCERIKDAQEAEQLLHRAQVSGDDVLARAVVGRAFEVGWSAVVDEYVSSTPSAAPDVDALVALNATDQADRSAQSKFANAMTYAAVLPAELERVSDVDRLAAQAASVVEMAAQAADTSDIGLVPAVGGGSRLSGDTTPHADGWF